VLCRTPEIQTEEVAPMRRDELMNPDMLSEVILLVMGALMVFVLMLTGFFAVVAGMH
jgi:hypothetical protein